MLYYTAVPPAFCYEQYQHGSHMNLWSRGKTSTFQCVALRSSVCLWQ